MKSHRLLEHTADIKLEVKADTLPNLFTGALEGMAQILKKDIPTNLKKSDVTQQLSISSPTTTLLLIDFLAETLTISYLNQAVFYRIELQELTELQLKATIFGTKIDRFDEDIKAVTYHQAQIHTNEAGNYETMVIFDI